MKGIRLFFVIPMAMALIGCVSTSRVEEAINATKAVWTAVPTQTALASQTPLPTHTPLATYTPFPTLTLRPTYTPYPTPSPSPTPPPKSILLEEDFGSDTTCFETASVEAGDIFVENGALQLGVTALNEPLWVFCEGERFSDFTLEVETDFVGGSRNNAFGLLFRGQQNWAYNFVISTDGYYCLTYTNMENQEEDYGLISCWLPLPELNGPSRPNLLRVTAVRDRIELYVNDVQVGLLVEGSQLSGHVGLFAYAFDGNGTQISFDNLRVTEP
jgi:hypothetical protein